MADKWVATTGTTGTLNYSYIRNGGVGDEIENFKVEITTTPSTSITGTVNTSTSISNTVNTSTSITNTVNTSLTGKGTTNGEPIYTDLSKFGTASNTPIYIGVGSYGYGTATDKPIYTYLSNSNIGAKNDAPIYVRTSMPITEFTANIALQIYSWSNSMTTDGKQSIGNARRAAQDAFVRAEEFVKQLVRENYIVDIDETNGLVVWRTDINKIM